MQRLKSHIIDGDITKRLDAERRESKRAEARLRNGLHDLEEARFYCINRMIKEQRWIQRDLMRIKNGYSKKKAVSSFRRLCLDNNPPAKGTSGSSNTVLPTIPAVKDQTVIMESEGIRTQNYYSAKTGRVVIPPGTSLALQMQINDFLNGISSQRETSDAHAGEEEVQPSRPSSARKLKTETSIGGINVSGVKHSIAKCLSISGKPAGPDVANGRGNPAADGQTAQEVNVTETKRSAVTSDPAPKEIKPKQLASSPQLSACHENFPDDSEFYAPDGLPRTMHTMPSFLEAFAEAKKARYIRHRSKTDAEKELSISEIFGKRRGPVQDIIVKEVETAKDQNPTGKNSD
ncbi:coiled-coil domain-containing protein 190 [Heptranchias perlo]|uniref:coiled-coil domain-containing protein 190 n=1 Tax=Heptranchias perlo TaxID=212740 RepID=UPI0035597252